MNSFGWRNGKTDVEFIAHTQTQTGRHIPTQAHWKNVTVGKF